ncbi:sugar transferase [Patescibacteria group bacterium]|nr:sugar transferase [Patescibacteria group bacterium]
MKKLELTFAAILVPLDYLALLMAGTLAYFLRFESFVTEIRPVIFEMNFQIFFRILSFVAIAWIIVFALNGLYTIKRHKLISDFSKIFVACSAATLIIVVAFFFNFNLFSSRLIILTGWLLSIIIISLERVVIHYIKKIFYKKGIGVRQVVIIGDNKNAQDIINEFNNKPTFGFKVLKNFSNFDSSTGEQLNEILKEQEIDDVILANPELPLEQKNSLVNFCTDHQLNYKYAASLLETKLINFDLSAVGGVPLIEVKQTRLDGWGRIIKRLFDLITALLILIILSPLLIILGLFVKLTSAGPMIVKLPRIGANGQRFSVLKFRSMIKDAHKLKPELAEYNERIDGPLFKMEDDPRITKFGKFLRRWSLDELPQIINVISGQMSLVGPRPHEPEEVARYKTRQKKLLAIKPGITGMAQVSGRSDLQWEEEVRLDTYYVENWSLALDIQILLKTPRAVVGRRGAS